MFNFALPNDTRHQAENLKNFIESDQMVSMYKRCKFSPSSRLCDEYVTLYKMIYFAYNYILATNLTKIQLPDGTYFKFNYSINKLMAIYYKLSM